MSRATAGPVPVGLKLASHFTAIPDLLRLAQRAEALGYDSVWTTEGRMSPDAVTVTAAMAALTRRIRIGTSVLNPFTRTPGLLAVTAASIDQISRGRFILGIGAGDPSTLDKQHIGYDRPLTRLREYVAVARELWAGKNVEYAGETIRIRDLRMDFGPYHGTLPVYIGATGPRALRLADEIGDAILLTICVPRSYVCGVLALAGRGRGTRVVAHVPVVMDTDPTEAFRVAKPLILNYLTRFPALAKASGVPPELVAALRRASVDEGLALLPDRYVRELAAIGTPEDCRQWIREYSAGADEVLVMPAYGNPDTITAELAPDRLAPEPARLVLGGSGQESPA